MPLFVLSAIGGHFAQALPWMEFLIVGGCIIGAHACGYFLRFDR